MRCHDAELQAPDTLLLNTAGVATSRAWDLMLTTCLIGGLDIIFSTDQHERMQHAVLR